MSRAERLCRTDDLRYFKDGAEWHLDDCTSCECRLGEILCSVEDCEWKSCENPTKGEKLLRVAAVNIARVKTVCAKFSCLPLFV